MGGEFHGEIFKDGATIACKREGPLAAHIEPFANSLSKQGYTVASIRRQGRLAAGFSRWLQQQRVCLRSITSDHPRLYLRYRARRLRRCLGDAAGLRHLLEFLRHQSLILAEERAKRALTSAERCTQAYECHLREVRGLAKATIINYIPLVCSFLKDRFGNGPVRLERLGARAVVGFVQRQAPRFHPKRAKLLTTALGSFLE